MIRYAFVIGAILGAAMLLQSFSHAREMNMRFPTAKISQNERLLDADEITSLSCTDMARKIIEDIVKLAGSGWAVDMSGETVSHDDEFGFVYRYRVTYDFVENGENYSHDFLDILWSKDCKSMGIASVPMLEFKV